MQYQIKPRRINNLAVPDHKADISAALREAREATGLTQAEVGQALGIHGITISRWETGTRSPSPANYERTMAFYRRRLGQAKPDVPRGTSELSQPEGLWPDLISRFGRVAIRRGATDAEVDFLQAALGLPEALSLVQGEIPLGVTDEQRLFEHAGAVFEGLLDWVYARSVRRRGQHHFDVPGVPLGSDAMAGDGSDDPEAGRRKA